MNDDKLRVIFLDVDGPLITTSLYWLDSQASMQRKQMSTVALGWVTRLADEAGAFIVFNSMHNYHDTPTGNLKEDVNRWGVPLNMFHEDWRTDFPRNAFPNGRRFLGILDWIDEHGGHDKVDWICYDDENFTSDSRLIVVDFDRGVDYDAYLKGREKLGLAPPSGIITKLGM